MRIKTESKLTQSTARLRVALEIIDDLLQSTMDECYQPGGKKDRIRSRAKEFRDEVRKGGGKEQEELELDKETAIRD